jgi:hypothetical protein
MKKAKKAAKKATKKLTLKAHEVEQRKAPARIA